MCYITRPGSLRAFSFNGRCAPWFQRSFQLLVSVGDCVPWFQRSLTAASSIELGLALARGFLRIVEDFRGDYRRTTFSFLIPHSSFLID